MKCYKNFCSKYNQSALNPTEETIAGYIEFLAQKLTSYKSLVNYISGVRSYLKFHRKSTEVINTYHISLLLRACQLTMSYPSRKKEPVSIHELKLICSACDKIGAKGILLKVAVTFAFFGMLRQSNICPRVSKEYM